MEQDEAVDDRKMSRLFLNEKEIRDDKNMSTTRTGEGGGGGGGGGGGSEDKGQ